VTLTLADGPQVITAVAVFGERVDNDGIIDADLEAQEGGKYRSLASIRDARSPAWLAHFEPLTATAVRLSILRSGGPTDHTDVWEVEVYGRPLSEADLRTHLRESLDRLQREVSTVSNLVERWTADSDNLPVSARAAWTALNGTLDQLAREQPTWTDADRRRLVQTVGRIEGAASLAARLGRRLEPRATPRPERQAALARVRSEGHALRAEAGPAALLEVRPSALASREIALWLDPEHRRWNVTWGDGLETVVAGVEFSVEVDGQDVTADAAPPVVRAFQDPLGTGQALLQAWRRGGVRVERELRLYYDHHVVTQGGWILNEGTTDVRLGTARLLNVGHAGGWQAGSVGEPPAAVYLQGHSLLRSQPFAPLEASDPQALSEFRSSGVLALVSREPSAALIVGYVRADEAAPDLAATFQLDEGGTALTANSRFLGRVLSPGERVELTRLYLAAEVSPFQALEAYGDALARSSARPPRIGPTGLWCSWYAHRMGMTEEKVLANAAVAAKYFRPLGLEIMQLDHGWQRGDITGDWAPNERFPHGLKWLADELRQRHDLRLGLWISPTDVAETSELYQRHPDWMLRGPEGRPRVNWRWYWKPNPDCYELDATHPAAYRHIVDTFRRLTSEGASYFKIDFIAAAGGEHFVPHDAQTTRGWGVLHRAMEAIREGAGEQAWIRYCQTPPILSAGLANSAYGGNDTLDAGIPGRFDVLRDNAHALAAGWWLNDRPYHREVCDMSVRMQGSVEEVRLRAALMTLANCSISWSDELCYLPPSRLRLMQQCLPPGNPPMRPLDLLDREIPSVWHLKLTNAFESWDVVGLFNFDLRADSRTLDFRQMGIDPDVDHAVFEFWEERFLGLVRGRVELALPGESSRILSIRRVTGRPQLVGTDLHVLQGWHELKKLDWDGRTAMLSGVFRRLPGISGKAFFLVPPGYAPKFDFPLSPSSARLTRLQDPVWMLELEFVKPEAEWSIPFDVTQTPAAMEPTAP